jgi:hypothetical protein
MKQFLMLLGVAAVAGAMYVAAASGSQQTKFATQKEVAALQKKVKILTTEVNKTVAPEAQFSTAYILTCLAQINSDNSFTVHVLPVSQRGNSTSGYLFGDSVTSTPTTALDVDTATPMAVLQEFDPSCLSSALRHRAARLGIKSFTPLGG